MTKIILIILLVAPLVTCLSAQIPALTTAVAYRPIRVRGRAHRKYSGFSINYPNVSSFGLSATSVPSDAGSIASMKSPKLSKATRKAARKAKLRAQGGLLAFDTPYGALNPFGLYWGFLSIFLGIFWYAGLTMCRMLYFVTGGKYDPNRRIPVFFSHIWGTLLMRLSRSYPKMENRDVLKELHRNGRAAMYVANHNSWLDIPFLGATIGWRNYKMVAKKELLKVPILGPAIQVGGNVIVDRSNRKSQLLTLKSGINWLKSGVNLCTFPEGTRTKNGRIRKFKNGAFKMAHKANAPVVPFSIVGADNAMPPDWMFPFRPSRGVCKIVVHEPIESAGKTEDELAQAVRDAIISGLPEEQRPLKTTDRKDLGNFVDKLKTDDSFEDALHEERQRLTQLAEPGK